MKFKDEKIKLVVGYGDGITGPTCPNTDEYDNTHYFVGGKNYPCEIISKKNPRYVSDIDGHLALDCIGIFPKRENENEADLFLRLTEYCAAINNLESTIAMIQELTERLEQIGETKLDQAIISDARGLLENIYQERYGLVEP